MEKNPFNPDIKGGGLGWLAIGSFVVAWDTLAGETLTNSFARGREHESRLIRTATVGTLGYVALHLMDAIPTKYDLIDMTADSLGKLKERIKDEFTDRTDG